MKRFSSIFILLLSFTFTFSQTTELTKSKADQYNDFISKITKRNTFCEISICLHKNGLDLTAKLGNISFVCNTEVC